MLNHLHIENYALIHFLDISFQKGLTVITGETGAGKSILLGALSLLTGKKPQNTAFLQNDAKCIVEGEFDISSLNLSSFFEENDIDYQPVTIIRREINTHGKSRAFINDTPVALSILADLGESIIDIHSQHQTLQLKKEDFKINLIDGFAQNNDLKNAYALCFRNYTELHKKQTLLKQRAAENLKQQNYLSFLDEELEKAQLKAEEQEELESQLAVLSHAEHIKNVFENTAYVLDEDAQNIISQLTNLKNSWQNIASYQEQLHQIFERLDSSIIELKDLKNEVVGMNDRLDVHPEEISKIENRLNFLYNLEQKHHVQSVAELMQIHSDLTEKLQQITTAEDEIAITEKALAAETEHLQLLTSQLTDSRTQVIDTLSQLIQQTLVNLNMPKAQFQIVHREKETVEENGKDQFDFMFNANGGGRLAEIKEVASGGEMSRVMLALKSVISTYTAFPTIIFDEIDTGISGQSASKVGHLMKQTADHVQLIAITHLPQIAAMGHTHWRVSKKMQNQNTETIVEELNHQARIMEIATMLSGEKLTESALKAADELLENK